MGEEELISRLESLEKHVLDLVHEKILREKQNLPARIEELERALGGRS
jgi:hypothetical protein